jgi:hypothetical protein
MGDIGDKTKVEGGGAVRTPRPTFCVMSGADRNVGVT